MATIPVQTTSQSKVYCIVPGCKSVRRNAPHLIYHKFPKNGVKIPVLNNNGELEHLDRLQVWMESLRIKKNLKNTMAVCSLHFRKRDYLNSKNWRKRRVLNSTAVPSKCLSDKLLKSCKTAKQSKRVSKRLSNKKLQDMPKRGRSRLTQNKNYKHKRRLGSNASDKGQTLTNENKIEEDLVIAVPSEKMSSVKATNKMTTLDSTIEMFNKYKADEEEKSSDEESIHLVLEADDEKDAVTDNVKNCSENGKSPNQNGESEEDILNKFETMNGTPDVVDDKEEESLLNENDDTNDKDVTKEVNESDEKCDENSGSKEEVKAKELETVSGESESGEKDNEDTIKSGANDKVDSPNGEPTIKETEKSDKPENEELSCGPKEEVYNDKVEITVNEEEDKSVADNISSIKSESVSDKPKPQNEEGLEKCENSNDSTKSQNLDSEDLLDISIIRDADEDNASAIAENSNYVQSDDKSDNDDQDEGSNSDKIENDEIDVDQENGELTLTDKDHENEHMDFDEEESRVDFDKEQTNGGQSESDNRDDEDNLKNSDDMESDSVDISEAQDKDTLFPSDIQKTDYLESDEAKEKRGTQLDVASEVEGDEGASEEEGKPSTKRSLIETTDETVANKKIKLSDELKKDDSEIKCLTSFANFMKDKKLKNKLTRSHLEQFCIQKICEVIMHKTVEGEMHQRLKKQEQTIETLRKDFQQLSKQARDLEIVNKKLMNEVKYLSTKKVIVPLKITRSVGLQVKLGNGTCTPTRRAQQANNYTTPPKASPNTNISINRNHRPAPHFVRQVSATKSTQSSPKNTPSNTPLLSQALQTRRTTPIVTKRTTTPIRPKPAESKPSASVIDLTDEDDKAAKAGGKIAYKTVPLNQVKTVSAGLNKTAVGQSKTVAVGGAKAVIGQLKTAPTRTVTALPQGVRLTPTQVKNGSITLPAGVVTSNAPQVMYVVQPTSSLTQGIVTTTTAGGTPKAVLVNFQPANGVLTSALNGSAVSVIPKGNTVQLKHITTTAKKHPAPLPVPTMVRINADSLKAIPPRPLLSIRKTETGIILQWKMPYNLDLYETIASYQLYAYQETNAPPNTDMWRKVGDVKALALPMACTLTQFADKNKYYFAVRSVDIHKRIGPFSDPEEISL